MASLLPFRARLELKSLIAFDYEWNAESLGKLPKTMTSLLLSTGGEYYAEEETHDMAQYLPLSLESLTLLGYSPQHFTNTTLMPRGLKQLSLQVDQIEEQMFANMPPGWYVSS